MCLCQNLKTSALSILVVAKWDWMLMLPVRGMTPEDAAVAGGMIATITPVTV
jgi:hypothetical protein